MVIYKITNKCTQKVYIGQTVSSISIRWSQHVSYALKRKGKSVLSNAIQKYGKENFEIKIISKCNSIEEMNYREQYYIKLFNTLVPNGYNLDSGGKNKKMSQSTKDKLSAIRSGKKIGHFTDEHKRNLSLAHSGRSYPNRILSEDTKNKKSRAASGTKNPMYGKHHTEEVKKICSEVNIGNKYWQGKRHRIESKFKISKSKDKFKIKIMCISNNTQYESLHAASKALGISRTSIKNVLIGKYDSVKGFSFRYMESK